MRHGINMSNKCEFCCLKAHNNNDYHLREHPHKNKLIQPVTETLASQKVQLQVNKYYYSILSSSFPIFEGTFGLPSKLIKGKERNPTIWVKN